jgi:hypothetical protein
MVDIGLPLICDELLPVSDLACLASRPRREKVFLGLEFNQIYNIEI